MRGYFSHIFSEKNVSNDYLFKPLTKKCISKASLLKNLPSPLFSKEGYCSSLWQREASLLKNLPSPLFSKEGYSSSLWQREDRRDFIINVFIFMNVLVLSFFIFRLIIQ